MTTLRRTGQSVFALALCVSLVLWSVAPMSPHAPKVFETFQEHVQMIAEHGHSHGLAEDLFWVMHGHSHDAADHDHSQAVLAPGRDSEASSGERDAWRLRATPARPSVVFRIERPPRA